MQGALSRLLFHLYLILYIHRCPGGEVVAPLKSLYCKSCAPAMCPMQCRNSMEVR